MRLLTEIKQLKGQVAKIDSYNTLMMKQLGNIDSVAIDADMGKIFDSSVNSSEQDPSETTRPGREEHGHHSGCHCD